MSIPLLQTLPNEKREMHPTATVPYNCTIEYKTILSLDIYVYDICLNYVIIVVIYIIEYITEKPI